MNNTLSLKIKKIIFILLLLVFITTPYQFQYSKNIIYLCAILSIFYFLFYENKITMLHFNNKNLIPLAIFIYGLSFFIWTIVFGNFSGNYSDHLEKARVSISIALILYFLFPNTTLDLLEIKILSIASFCFIILIFSFAIFQTIYLADIVGKRVTFYYGIGATETAYITTIFALFSQHIIFLFNHKSRINYVVIFLSYTVVLLTGTRSAILVFPILLILLQIFESKYRKNFHKSGKSQIKITILACIISLFFSILLNGEQLIDRSKAGLTEIQQYTNSITSNSSVGARLAMYEFGIETGLQNIMGQSIEDRKQHNFELTKENLFYASVLPFLDKSHLHNEFIENFSLRGLWGILILLFFYISIIHTAIQQKNSLLLIIGITTICYGITDVILNGKLIYIYLLAITFSALLDEKIVLKYIEHKEKS